MPEFRKGQKFRSLRFQPVKGLILFRGGNTQMFEGVFPRDRVAVIAHRGTRNDPCVEFRPESYDYFLKMYLPVSVRENPDFESYVLTIPLEDLQTGFEEVTENSNA